MSGLLNFLFAYIALLVFWLIVNAICYALTIIVRKGFFFAPYALNVLISWFIQIYLVFCYLYILWQIIAGGEWILLVLMLVLGGFWIGFWQMVIDFLMFPINGVTLYFSRKAAEKLEEEEDDFEYEVISPEGKLIGKYQSLDKIHKLLAKWFLISYGVIFINPFTKGENYEGVAPVWVFISPLLVMVFWSAVIAIFMGIWNLIRARPFLGEDKIVFVTTCLKIVAIIYGFSIITNLLFY